ncbi:MAG: zinc ribbon domain-containing protein [Methanobrevibacter sp.]|uniref:zinc ribbon domain-containing protein n=1 Tax=Methanobrevibacter sp. TaxID=66852 RepID=UPI0025FD904B|nr:zinc ribbon domain-containing protein [Methanobrevibacter sp.]MBQ6100165.1 zinc ribbon domain-containing protein [Methanobrevibacter sp.]
MTKVCPNCGKEVPDDAHFCVDCGHDFIKKDSSKTFSKNNSNNIFTNGKIFLVLIAVVVIVGAAIILSFGSGGHGSEPVDEIKHEVDLTITEVDGWDGDSSSKKSYTLYTEAIFNKVPSDLKGYNVKTTYVDANGSDIGYEIETLDNVYYDSNYALSFGHYTTYKKPNPDHVNVEIIKDGKTIDNFTSKIDKSKIDYLN